MLHIGQKLRDLREYYGLSQAEVARKIGVAASTVSTWELSEYATVEAILHYCELFGENPAAIFDQNYQYSKIEREIIEEVRARPGSARALLEFLKAVKK